MMMGRRERRGEEDEEEEEEEEEGRKKKNICPPPTLCNPEMKKKRKKKKKKRKKEERKKKILSYDDEDSDSDCVEIKHELKDNDSDCVVIKNELEDDDADEVPKARPVNRGRRFVVEDDDSDGDWANIESTSEEDEVEELEDDGVVGKALPKCAKISADLRNELHGSSAPAVSDRYAEVEAAPVRIVNQKVLVQIGTVQQAMMDPNGTKPTRYPSTAKSGSAQQKDDRKILKRWQWSYVLTDEARSANQRLMLIGTPLQNDLNV
ncbi:hypothetical protein C1H46_000951 [Malus baccata]|uniref:Uncharacterized protein n=1 Tax=Malus baccata TaxID=106549 RepID=A0A540NQS5_MALBA|nr:hypothetical protein C1H46_000951 [Malus baccata]